MWRIVVLLIMTAGCASLPVEPVAVIPPTQALPTLEGSYYVVRRGETLWRIARAYGLDVNALTAVNHLPSAHHLSAGQRLFIPLPAESTKFLWPLRGSVKNAGGAWVEITAPAGSLVRASRTGRVAVAARHLAGSGRTIVIDHLDGYVSIYAGLDQLLAAPDTVLRQGMLVGSVGASPLHFEIRYDAKPKNALALLPDDA